MQKKFFKPFLSLALAGLLILGEIPVSAQTSSPSLLAETITDGSYESNLPVVYITTENNTPITSKETYLNATMTIQGNDTFQDISMLYDGAIEIRGRGNSTWNQPKQPYKIKLDKKADLFGMGKHKHWVLLANYMDETLMRNTLAYNLSGNLGMPQMDTVWVDVVLNGKYIGNYQFCEQIKLAEDNRVDVFDWESFAEDTAATIAEAEGFTEDQAGDLEDYMKETNMSWITSGSVTFQKNTYTISDYDITIPSITGGYLLELDEYYDEVSKFKTNSNQPIMFKNPEFVTTNKDMMNYVQTYVQSFEDAVASPDYTANYLGDTLHYSQLFDFESLVDYWLISEIFFNEELNKKSTYMYKEIDELMKMGPIWDMDYSSGGEGQTYHTTEWATLFFNTNAQANMWYKDLIKDPYFVLRAQERYWEIRNTHVQDMVDSIDDNQKLLETSANRNAAVWEYKTSFASYVSKLQTWFEDHLTWLDEQMTTQNSLLTSLQYQAGDLSLSLTTSENLPLEEDIISSYAPADGMIMETEGLTLSVDSKTYSGQANVFVNGKKVSSVTLGDKISLTQEQLTALPGEKNIIEVQYSNAANNVIVKNYITVLETPAPIIPLLEEYVSLDSYEFTYDGTEKIPNVTVTYQNHPLTEGIDYTVEISNNIEAGTATVTIIGIGRYEGSVTKAFTISKNTSSEEENENNTNPPGENTGTTTPNPDSENGSQTQTPGGNNTSDNNNHTQTPGSNNTTGNNSHIQGSGNDGTVQVPQNNHTIQTPEDTSVKTPDKVTKVSQTAGKEKSITFTWEKLPQASGYEIARYDTKTKKYTTVKTITSPSTTRFTQKKLKAATTYQYKVRGYLLVNGQKVYGDYSDAVSMTTAPGKVKLKKITSSGKSLKITWTPQKCKGYEIQVSTKKNFKGSLKKATIKKAKTGTKTIKGLSSGKKYYIRIRCYTKLAGKTYYSNWSKKNISIKK